MYVTANISHCRDFLLGIISILHRLSYKTVAERLRVLSCIRLTGTFVALHGEGGCKRFEARSLPYKPQDPKLSGSHPLSV